MGIFFVAIESCWRSIGPLKKIRPIFMVLGNIHMTKQLLKKKHQRGSKKSISSVCRGVIHLQHRRLMGACKLLLGGRTVKGWMIFCCVPLIPWNTIYLIADLQPTWDHPNCARVSNLVLWTITIIISNKGFFYLPPKIMVQRSWMFWRLKQKNFLGEKHRPSCHCRFRCCFSNSNILHSNRLPNICWDPPCQSSPWML